MSDDDHRTGARFINELGVVLRSSKGGEPLDDRAFAHDVSVRGFKVETQAHLAENMILSFTLELPMGASVAGKGRVVWHTRDMFSMWAGVEIVSMSWSDKRRLSHLLSPGNADWDRLINLCAKLVMALVVIAAARRIILSAPMRALVGQLAPKIITLLVMGWALLGMLKRGKR